MFFSHELRELAQNFHADLKRFKLMLADYN